MIGNTTSKAVQTPDSGSFHPFFTPETPRSTPLPGTVKKPGQFGQNHQIYRKEEAGSLFRLAVRPTRIMYALHT